MRLWFPALDRPTQRPLSQMDLWRRLLDESPNPDETDTEARPLRYGHHVTQPGDPAAQVARVYVVLAEDEEVVKRRQLHIA